MSSEKLSGNHENVRVVCRCRPVNQIELDHGSTTCVQFTANDPRVIQVSVDDCPSIFHFDYVFDTQSLQSHVYENTVDPLIEDVLNGYNATVFAYGQTGTGKTYTMEGCLGDVNEKGIVPRSVGSLFEGVKNSDESMEFVFKVSYVEIYMEKIRDLLDNTRVKTNLTVREDKIRGIYIAGVTEEYVASEDELFQIMQNGSSNRATAATGMNEGSSRSHSVFTISISQRNLLNSVSKTGKLVLIDLAGSEMVRKTNASGLQLEEAKTINKSLSALGQVIYALTDDKQIHIPYRDSKLTRVLQDSLGGNSKTVLIVAISPSSYNANETLSTLRFGQRAKSIKNKVVVNATRSVQELEGLLMRAEKAIDMQSAHILSLSKQLEDIQQSSLHAYDNTGDDSTQHIQQTTSIEAPTPTDTDNINKNENNSIQELKKQILQLHQELEEEKEDAKRKDDELVEMTSLLKSKESLLLEAGGLLEEARTHYETQRERGDNLLKEKAEVIGHCENLRNRFQDELEKTKYDLKESELRISTLTLENERMVQEIAEFSGDHTDHQNIGKNFNSMRMENDEVSHQYENSSLDNISTMNTSALSSVNDSKIAQASTSTNVVVESGHYQSSNELILLKEKIDDILSKININESNGSMKKSVMNQLTVAIKDMMDVSFGKDEKNQLMTSRIKTLESIDKEYKARIKELESQRDCLEKDVKERSDTVSQIESVLF